MLTRTIGVCKHRKGLVEFTSIEIYVIAISNKMQKLERLTWFFLGSVIVVVLHYSF